uniref:Retrovirus-related Pol polyprotein from transposon TNT 1-94 n=1 Tax=Tanacetum cinerariifolium TaxID=118510 RepID=A0A6L2NDE3_TANCI|nr:retrovirus-related Pol polyprotein from transposon TNT 1-94 [Tanacetum cinerariifolium]
MKSSTTNVETSINEEVFHEFSESFQRESSSSSLNDDVQQSPKEVILPSSNTQSIPINMIHNGYEASTSHNVFNERLEDAYFDASTSFHDPSVGKPVDHTDYRSMIGSLMYVTSSRPDIMFATCLWYPKDSSFDITTYSKADHAGCHLDRKSTSGSVQFLGDKLAKKESSDEECLTSESKEEEYVVAVKDFKKFFKRRGSEIVKDGKVIGRGIKKKDLYVMKLGTKPEDKICLATIDVNFTLWHRRLGHANMRLIQSLASKELVRNLPKLKFDQHFCDACKIGKQAYASHKAKNIVSTIRCLELLHMYLFSPSGAQSYGGNLYTLVIVDDYSRYTWARFLKNKTETFEQIEIFSKKIQNQLGCSIVSIRTDHGRELDNEVQFEKFCNANGITHNFSAPRTLQSSGVVERKNKTLQEMSRTMLNEKSLPQKFWCNTVDTSTYILNQILIRAILGEDTSQPPPPPIASTEAPQMVSSVKLHILKKGEYIFWTMKMEQYLAHLDYALWEQILARTREEKAKSTLLMAISDEHLARFHEIKDAKTLWAAIKTRFGEGLDKGYDRFQRLLSLLEIHEAESTSSTNEVNVAYSVSTAIGHSSQAQGSSSYADELMFLFFANQSSSPQLDNEDLEQIDQDDLKEMDLKWDCRTAKNSGNRSRDARNAWYKGRDNGKKPAREEDEKALVVQDGLEEEVTETVFDNRSSDEENSLANDRFKKGKGYHAVPPHLTGNYMPPKSDLSFAGLDDSVYKFKISETLTSLTKDEKDALETSTVIRSFATDNIELVWRDKDGWEVVLSIRRENRGHPQQALKNKGIVNSGCSRHMTGNKAYLADYQKIYDGGFVAFGSSIEVREGVAEFWREQGQRDV